MTLICFTWPYYSSSSCQSAPCFSLRSAVELIEEVGKEPTLDVALDREGKAPTQEALKHHVAVLRAQRAYINPKSRKWRADLAEDGEAE